MEVLVTVVEPTESVFDGKTADVMVLPTELGVVMTLDAGIITPPGVEEARRALILDSRAAI